MSVRLSVYLCVSVRAHCNSVSRFVKQGVYKDRQIVSQSLTSDYCDDDDEDDEESLRRYTRVSHVLLATCSRGCGTHFLTGDNGSFRFYRIRRRSFVNDRISRINDRLIGKISL